MNPTKQSQVLLDRARRVVPNGVYGHYGYSVTPEAPVFFEHARGAHFTDVDGNEYVDWMCAYGPMILGYDHPDIEAAAARQLASGNTVSLASPVMVELAERVVDRVKGIDWALFGKNGADATALAVMIARAATGRRYIVKIDGGYHGAVPWMQTPGAPGTIEEDQAFVLSVPWNDPEAVQRALEAHPDDVACFISSPYHHPVLEDNALPADGYWRAIETLCRTAGVAIILDDVRAGFRIDLSGSHAAFGFQPDFVCFGKALANGHPISALTGTDAFREAAQATYYTGTQFFNAAPMAAALATLEALEKADAARTISDLGRRLGEGLREVAAAHDYDLVVSGVPGMPYFSNGGEGGGQRHQAWVAECVKRGAYLLSYHNNFVSTAHTDEDIDRTCEIADAAFAALG
ncbi:MAG: aminotransferase class III-fold pyridoxal phosphate-dependent enzyme [Myxococcota bacterium]